MKVAIPDAAYLRPLVARAADVCAAHGWDLQVVPEERAGTMLVNHLVDLALVSPMGYGAGVGKVDLRIIPGPCMVLTDYTNVAGIRFKDHIEEIRSMGSRQPQAFLPIIGSLMMREKFEAPASPLQAISKGAPADCMIDINTEQDPPAALDVSEEWFDAVEMPLPVAVWACRVEADLDKVGQAVRQMAQEPLADVAVHEPLEDASMARQGTISWAWNADVEEAFEGVLNLLFFHQLLREIPAVKVLGREES